MTAGGDIRARHVAVACLPGSAELHGLFDAPRRAVVERDLIATHYVSAAVKVRNWFATHRRAHLRNGDHRDHLIAARCEGPAGDGSLATANVVLGIWRPRLTRLPD